MCHFAKNIRARNATNLYQNPAHNIHSAPTPTHSKNIIKAKYTKTQKRTQIESYASIKRYKNLDVIAFIVDPDQCRSRL